jgi:uncharacterized protein YbbC (DUF1343 family)
MHTQRPSRVACLFLFFAGFLFLSNCYPQRNNEEPLILVEADQIICGAERTSSYFPLLEDKSVGIICNHTSLIAGVHLVDSLINSGIHIKAIFSPEHGFRGNAEAGAIIDDGKDHLSGVRIISLYGKKKKPEPGDLEGIDILLFDIQDVGVRFYTYISTLSLVMQAAAENDIPLIVTDRPNPNGFYVDGPVLDTTLRSFVGMHTVPIVYGMTIGEYAMMVNEEGWSGNKKCNLKVIPLEGYTHSMIVKLEIKPSPNLPTWQSIYLYPSLCLFEGTIVSVGRGTDYPFQVIGHPDYMLGSYAFTPVRIPGVSENPPYEGKHCFGHNLTGYAENYAQNPRRLNLDWLIFIHEYLSPKHDFFTSYFDKLAGTRRLKENLESGKSESEIRSSWESPIKKFEKTRKKYLLYPE